MLDGAQKRDSDKDSDKPNLEIDTVRSVKEFSDKLRKQLLGLDVTDSPRLSDNPTYNLVRTDLVSVITTPVYTPTGSPELSTRPIVYRSSPYGSPSAQVRLISMDIETSPLSGTICKLLEKDKKANEKTKKIICGPT